MTQDTAVAQTAGPCTCCGELGGPITLELPGRTYYFCIDCADVQGWELSKASREERNKIDLAELQVLKGVAA